MLFFIPDAELASALAASAKHREVSVEGLRAVKGGVVCDPKSVIHGVIVASKAVQRDAIELYYSMFEGAWQSRGLGADNGSLAEDFSVFVSSDDGGGLVSEYDRKVEALIAKDVATIAADAGWPHEPLFRAGLKMRARSAVRALQSVGAVEVRHGFERKDVVVEARRILFARYFDVEDLALRHRKFDGLMSDVMTRSVLRSADAVTVLPYDPILDKVVLVEQFRPAAFVRGDPNPWVLEPVAGRCDGDDAVEEVARREMVEEAGLTLMGLEVIGNYYPSPGCLSEYLYSFVGLVDLSERTGGVFGLEAENEDIKTHLLPFSEAMRLVETGEAENGPLLLSLLWLAANRTRLREAAGSA